MAKIGYARVSTTDQDLETQLARLRGEGCEVVRAEKVSGASREGRRELEAIIAFLRPKGSGSVYVDGTLDDVKVNISGSGDTELRDLTAKSVQVEIRGSGSVSANGAADAVDVNISGSGDAALRKLTAKSVRVNIQGSGDASLTAQVDADVFVSGSGDVELSGGPVMRRSEVRGSGSIRQVP